MISKHLLRYPELHRTCTNSIRFPYIVYYCVVGTFQSISIYYIVRNSNPDGSFTENGFFCFLGVVIVVAMQVSTWMKHWTWVTTAANIGSVVIAIATMIIYSVYAEPELKGTVAKDFASPKMYLVAILILIVSTLPSLMFEFVYNHYFPTLNRLLREKEVIDRGLPNDFAESMKIIDVSEDPSEINP